MTQILIAALLAGSAALTVAAALAEVARSRAECRLLDALDGFEAAPSPASYLALRGAVDLAERAGVYLGTYRARIDTAVTEAPLLSLLHGWQGAMTRAAEQFAALGVSAARLQGAFAEFGRAAERATRQFRETASGARL